VRGRPWTEADGRLVLKRPPAEAAKRLRRSVRAATTAGINSAQARRNGRGPRPNSHGVRSDPTSQPPICSPGSEANARTRWASPPNEKSAG